MRTSSILALLAASCLVTAVAPGVAHAIPNEPIGYHSVAITSTLSRTDTDFIYAIDFAQIDPAHFATVQSIVVTISGTVFGDYTAVNTSRSSNITSGTAELKATISVFTPDATLSSSTVPDGYVLPGGPSLGVAIPVLDQSITPATMLAREPSTFKKALFNINDPTTYAAASAVHGYDLTATQTTTTTTDGTSSYFNDLSSQLVGYGEVYLPVEAAANSTFIGGGNLASQFNTDAGATVMITVNYITVPEPASLALLGAGVILAGVVRRLGSRRA